jgi:hypothetical protein
MSIKLKQQKKEDEKELRKFQYDFILMRTWFRFDLFLGRAIRKIRPSTSIFSFSRTRLRLTRRRRHNSSRARTPFAHWLWTTTWRYSGPSISTTSVQCRASSHCGSPIATTPIWINSWKRMLSILTLSSYLS